MRMVGSLTVDHTWLIPAGQDGLPEQERLAVVVGLSSSR
jgi:hypothetical protein